MHKAMVEQIAGVEPNVMACAYYIPGRVQTLGGMVNEDYQLSEDEEEILSVIKEGRDTGGPWGYATPRHLREETGIEKSNVEYCLRQLTTAGWISKVTRGFYRFVEDPRERDDA